MKKIIFILMCAASFILSGCQSYGSQMPQSGFTAIYDQSAANYLQQATQAAPPAKQDYQLRAVGRLLQDNQLSQAQQLLISINTASLTPAQTNEKNLLSAQLYLLQNQPELALNTLNNIPDVPTLSVNIQRAYYQQLAKADAGMGNQIASAEDLMKLDPLLTDNAQQANRQIIWQTLQQASTTELNAQLHFNTDAITRGWLDLAYVMKMYQGDAIVLSSELQNWETEYPNHPAQYLVTQALASHSATTKSQTVGQVGLLLPETGSLNYAGNAVRSGVMAAYYDTLATSPSHSIQTYSTYSNATSGGASWVIGPLDKTAVTALAQTSLSVPVLALNFTPQQPSSNKLYQFALSPQDEAVQVALKAQHDGYRHVLIIAPATSWGHGVTSAFEQSWQSNGGSIADQFYYTNQNSLDPGIKRLLQISPTGSGALKHRQDADVIFLVADPVTARQVKPLLHFYYANDIPVYATSMVYAGKPNATLDRDLDGIQFCDIPFVIQNSAYMQQVKQQMKQLLPNASPQSYRLYAFGYDAYNLVPLLAHLGNDPSEGYQGLTGKLYLGSNQQVKRQLAWAKFNNGVPVAE